jgi:hypothetical protein
MCVQIQERYAVCRCLYYIHALDSCPAYGRRGHDIRSEEILVAYSCPRHSRNYGSEGFISDAKCATIRSGDSPPRKEFAKHEDDLGRTAVEATIDSPLRAQLLEKIQYVLGTEEQFIPAGDLDEVLTTDAIDGELQSCGLGDISSDVFPHAKKIFAILLAIRKLDALQDLIKEGVRDDVLPLAISATSSLEDQKLYYAFSEWDLDARKHFEEFQWTLLAPIFSEGMHLKLHDDARLPFIKTEPLANGAFGGVHRVEIHSDHERLNSFGSHVTRKVSLKS